MIAQLRDARKSPAVVIVQLLEEYRPDGESMHFFFEGQDEESFYQGPIDQLYTGECAHYPYRCYGKSNVIAVHRKIDWQRFEQSRLLFFVDRDYSDLLGEDVIVETNVFVTDGYSIETYLADDRVIRRYCREILHCDDNAEVAEVARRIQCLVEAFRIACRRIAAWIIAVRRVGSRPQLANVRLDRLFIVTDELCLEHLAPSRRGLAGRLCVETGIPYQPLGVVALRQAARDIEALSASRQIRGKYIMWAIVEGLKVAPGFLSKRGVKVGKNRSNLSAANAIEILGPRLAIPDDVRAFLSYHCTQTQCGRNDGNLA